MKNLVGLALCAGVLLSSQSFASIRVTTLSCGALVSSGHPLLGVGYQIQIKDGFDTHVRNPNGTTGAPIAPTFQLVARVISPSAQPRYVDLAITSRDAEGNFNLEGPSLTAVVNSDFTKGIINMYAGTATCQ